MGLPCLSALWQGRDSVIRTALSGKVKHMVDAKGKHPLQRLLILLVVASMLILSGSMDRAQAAQGAADSGDTGFETSSPNETIFMLANGLKVYLIRDTRFPMVCTRLYVRTGSSNEKPRDFGISHVLEHMVFKGTTTRPKGQIAREVESLGGYLNAYTSFDKTCYLTDMPARHWQTGIDIVRDMAFHPLLDPSELEKEKPVIISEMEGNEDEPSYRLFLEVQKAGLAGTPYAHPIIGTRQSVNAVTSDSLRAYFNTWYQPQNMLLVVAGDLDPEAVRAYVEKNFSSLANRGELRYQAPIEADSLEFADKGRVEVIRGKWNKVYLSLAFPVPGLRDYTSLDLDLLAYLLAGDGTTPFERKYRNDLQLVDSISVSNMSLSRIGLFTISAILDADKTEKFFTELVRDLARFKTGDFTAGDLARAKFVTEDEYDRSSETLNGLTSWRAQMEFEMGGRLGEANMRKALRSVDFAQIESAYKKYIRPERVNVRLLAPEKTAIGDLAAILEREWPKGTVASGHSTAATENGRESIHLENGVQLVLIRDNTIPYVSVDMAAAGGNALLNVKTQGLATLVADSLSDGCGELDRVAFEKALASRAQSLSAKSGRQTFRISASTPSRYTDELLALMSSYVTAPRFEESEIARAKKDMQSARVIRDDDSMSRLVARLWPALFGTHPYGLDSLGTEQGVNALTRDDVVRYWKEQMAQPWVVVFTGKFDRDKAIAWAKTLPRATARRLDVQAPVWGKDRALTVQAPDRNKAHLVELWPTVPQTHPDAPALTLLQAVLSGQSGLLFSRMRDEESLGYTVTAQNISFQKTGLMLFYAGTTPDRVEEARKGFAAIVQNLKEKELDPALLEAACNVLEGRYVRSRQSLSARGGEAAMEELFGLPRNFALQQLEKARKVTPADIREVVRRYFGEPYVAVVHP